MYVMGDRIDVAGRMFRIDGAFPAELRLTEVVRMCEACDANEAYYDSPDEGTMNDGGPRFLCPRCMERANIALAMRHALEHLIDGDDELRATLDIFDSCDAYWRNQCIPYVDTGASARDTFAGRDIADIVNDWADFTLAMARVYAR